MIEREFARKMTHELDRAPVSPKAAERLRKAREIAVARAASQPVGVLAGVGNLLVRFWHQHHMASIGVLLALSLMVAGGGWHWYQGQEADQAIEAMLLADDLPMDMFLSERF